MSQAVKASEASASGVGGVTPKAPAAQGGIIEGKGQIIRANGEVVEFELKSDPLTQDQADSLNEKQAEKNGGNSHAND